MRRHWSAPALALGKGLIIVWALSRLTAATLLIVSYSVQNRVRESIHEELRNSVDTYKSFEKQREDTLTKLSNQ